MVRLTGPLRHIKVLKEKKEFIPFEAKSYFPVAASAANMETLLDLALGLLRLGGPFLLMNFSSVLEKNEYRTCLLEANLEGCSWPVFPLKHHMLVWMAARRVVGLVPLTNYAILGDDIVPMRKWQYTRHCLVCILTLSPEKSLI